MTVGLDPTGIVSHPDEFHRGQSWKRYVDAASTANITIASPGTTIDGVTMAVGKRFLAKNQTTGSQNGIYDWNGAATPATRVFDMDQDTTYETPQEEVLGAVVHVIAGTANGGTLWRCTNTAAPVLGTTTLTFALVFGSGAAALDDLSDVVISSPANADRLRFNSATGVWEDSPLVWEPMIASDGTVMTDGLLNPMQAEVPY